MRSRKEIKAIGRERLKANYWSCVLACLLVCLAIFAIPMFLIVFSYSRLFLLTADSLISSPYEAVLTSLGSMLLIYAGGILILLLSGPLGSGLDYFNIMNILGRDDLVTVGTPFRSAFTRFGRKLGGYLWMKLFLFLWGLIAAAIIYIIMFVFLFVFIFSAMRSGAPLDDIPVDTLITLFVLIYLGLFLGSIPRYIKTFSYAMTTYILADCPNVKAQDALKLSTRIMKGHKWQLFVFGLSFLGWQLLSALTLGLLDIFYVGPYMNSAFATYYLEVREEALRSGVITMGQLEGTEPV